jgi:glycosyltransferase involved in cell wall biosynthesis
LEKWTDDPFSYVKTADCVLFPSLSEGYGMVAMEAHAAGTPIIMTDVGVANYELPAGPKVIITPLDDRDKFIQAILQL